MTTVSPKPTSHVAEAGASYFPIALIARLPFSMMVVGVLTLVVAGRDSIALGGLNSAMVGLGSAVAGPFLGMAADRFGQRPAMLVAGIGNSLALLAMALVVYSPAPDGLVLATAFFVGATAPQVAPMSRSRLVGIIRDQLPMAPVPEESLQALDELLFLATRDAERTLAAKLTGRRRDEVQTVLSDRNF